MRWPVFIGDSEREAHSSDEGEALSESAQKDVFLPADAAASGSHPEEISASKWFAIYTLPRHEKRVAQYLTQRGIEHYLPLYHPRRRWSDGSIVTLDLPLFPGYLFVRTDRSARVQVLRVPGVLAFVCGTGRQPTPLPEAEIVALQSGLPLRHAEPHPLLIVGQRTRIRCGPLAGMEGVVVRKKNNLRVVLTLDLIQQSVVVEVDGEELESVAATVPSTTCAG
jgi:transcription antitermination factor NusG